MDALILKENVILCHYLKFQLVKMDVKNGKWSETKISDICAKRRVN